MAGNIYIVIDENHCDAERIRIRVESEIRVLSRLRYLDENLEAEWRYRQRHFFPRYSHQTNSLKVAKCWTNQSVPTSWYSYKNTWEQVIKEMPDQVKLMLEIDLFELYSKQNILVET